MKLITNDAQKNSDNKEISRLKGVSNLSAHMGTAYRSYTIDVKLLSQIGLLSKYPIMI